MYLRRSLLLIIAVSCLLVASSCKKFLDEKPNQKLTTPATLDDLSQLLNYYDRMNAKYPSVGEMSADNYYLLDDSWASLGRELPQNLYIWKKVDDVGSDWTSPYQVIMTANVILDNIETIKLKTSIEKQKALELKSMAYFIRAYYHYSLSQSFMKVYDKTSANGDLGIPLKKSSDMNEKVIRATSQQTYDFIISDVKNAILNLPKSPNKKYLPSRPAAYGLLSRIYLSMQMYNDAGKYADSCLQLYSTLIDYNTVDETSDSPFKQFNDEDIYDTQAPYPGALYPEDAKIDSTLYNSYQQNDIRKYAFFSSNGDGTYFFKGNYTGLPFNPTLFTGIATDEMYLTRAECFARAGDSVKALSDLNTLMSKRIRSTEFMPYSLPVSGGLLKKILIERRKELLYRELRWTDLRRLNKEPEFADTLYRILNGQQYQLLPNSDRYTLQIDKRTIERSGIQQNP